MKLTSYLRTVSRNKLIFVIKILGLSMALSTGVLLLLFCFEELGYDNFHKNKDNIYRIVCKVYENGEEITESATVPAPVGAIIHRELPEIINYSRVTIPYKDDIFKYKNNYIQEFGCWTDTAFLHIFSIPIISGDKGALKPDALLISEKLAKKYFGEDDPVGKTLYNYGGGSNGEPYIISGVFRLPENTHFNINTIQSNDFLDKTFKRGTNWNNYEYTYILLDPDSKIKEVENKISQVVNQKRGKYNNENIRYEFSLQKLEDIYLNSNLKNEAKGNGDINLIRALFLLAIAIIIIAWINYINLSIAASFESAKETGIRIIHGASKFRIFTNTLTESIITNGLSLLVAIFIIALAFPSLNHFVGKDLHLGLTPTFWIICISTFGLGTIISGLYPAITLTSLRNKDILKGQFKYSRKGIISRKIFMGIQLSASIAVIVITLFVHKQIKFMKSYDKGFNSEQVICVDNISTVKEGVNKESYKDELLKYPQILKVTKAKTLPGNDVYLKELVRRADSDISYNKIFEVMVADEDYIDVFQFKIIAGRKFSKEYSTDKRGVILNEEAVKYLNFNTPSEAIDKEIIYRNKNYKIVGVIQNFNQLPLQYSIQPFAYFLASQGFYAMRVNTADLQSCISIIDKITKSFFEGNFKYFLVDDVYNDRYKTEIKFSKLFTFFSIVAIIISSFGLFGLAFLIEFQRQKEMAIRVVNGAKRWSILFSAIKNYITLIIISFCLICPVAIYIIYKWLENFAYKTIISWWVFVLGGLIAIGIALITVSLHSWRAATQNPIRHLNMNRN